jgi:hypothetical protein
MRSHQATHNLFAISANLMEEAINTEQDLDTLFKIDLATLIKYDRRRETDADEAMGHEEITKLYDLGYLASIPLAISKCQPQHVACFGAYALGAIDTDPAGSTGFKHTITPISGDLESARSNPSFTFAMRYGLHLLKQRFASGFINSFSLSFERDKFLKLDADIKATGKRTTNMYEESVTAHYNATSLTLTHAVAGGAGAPNAQNRLDNIHAIRVQVLSTLQWVDVIFSAVSDADHGVITIVAPGGTADDVTYKILYNIKEAGDNAWCDFSGLDDIAESPLRVSDFLVKFGGKWNGSDILGGRTIDADINSVKWTFDNKITPEFTMGAATVGYANRALREGREQKIEFDRKFREYIIGNYADTMETFALYAIAEGAEYETNYKFTVELILPKVAVMGVDPKLSGKRLDETANIVIMEDAIYGSAILNIKNQVDTYAA